MINYEFLERRFDQLSEDSWRQGEYMVDALLNKNVIEFEQINQEVDDICFELWQINDDIPF